MSFPIHEKRLFGDLLPYSLRLQSHYVWMDLFQLCSAFCYSSVHLKGWEFRWKQITAVTRVKMQVGTAVELLRRPLTYCWEAKHGTLQHKAFFSSWLSDRSSTPCMPTSVLSSRLVPSPWGHRKHGAGSGGATMGRQGQRGAPASLPRRESDEAGEASDPGAAIKLAGEGQCHQRGHFASQGEHQ